MTELDEFELIARHFTGGEFATAAPGVVLGVGDDCAILRVPDGSDLLVAVDTVVAGVHFPADIDPGCLAHRALAVNLSDLAAMGADPLWFTLALTLPEAREEWLAPFSSALAALARRFGIALVGGDTTSGPLAITIQVHGVVPSGMALRRDGARPGDEVWVSGRPGLAALGLRELLAGSSDSVAAQTFLYPEPRIALGKALRGIATAAIDFSDGLFGDAAHIAERSGVGIVLDPGLLPLAPELQALADREEALSLVLGGGDDYELCFTAEQAHATRVTELARVLALPCTRIGRVEQGRGVHCAGFVPRRTGYRHFSGA